MAGTKKEFYNAMLRNGWYLPKFSTPIVTQAWLDDIRTYRIWYPRYDTLRLRPCPLPPKKLTILEELANACMNANKNMPVTKPNSLPDVDWCLACLSTLNPDHEFFTKSYMPEQPNTKKGVMKQIDNHDSFYDDLPMNLKQTRHL